MSLIEKYIEQSEDKGYYSEEISKLNEEQKKQLEILLQKLDDCGAKDPLSWAHSEVRENIPQFARFLFLKGVFEIIDDTEENMALADDVDEDYAEDIFEVSEKLEEAIGSEELNEFLKSYTRGVVWQVLNHIDEGNYNNKSLPEWSLKETSNSANRNIGGLHESFNEFKDELK